MKKITLLLFFLSIGMVGGLLSLHFFSFNYIQKYLLGADRSNLIPIEVIEVREIFVKENELIVDRIERVEKSVVGVRTGTRAGFIEGSGLIVSSDGLLITLDHLVPIGGNFNFSINGNDVSYEIIKRDPQKNLALIKVNQANLPTLEFRNPDNLKRGEKVFLVGAVFNENQEIIKSTNQGIIKSIDNYIKTSIFEEKKLSGSTLFDVEGKVLGLNLIDQIGEVYTLPVPEIRDFIGF